MTNYTDTQDISLEMTTNLTQLLTFNTKTFKLVKKNMNTRIQGEMIFKL